MAEEKQLSGDIWKMSKVLSGFNGKVFEFDCILKSSVSKSRVLVLRAFGCTLLVHAALGARGEQENKRHDISSNPDIRWNSYYAGHKVVAKGKLGNFKDGNFAWLLLKWDEVPMCLKRNHNESCTWKAWTYACPQTAESLKVFMKHQTKHWHFMEPLYCLCLCSAERWSNISVFYVFDI